VFIHLGGNKVVSIKEIIAIIDASGNKHSVKNGFLEHAKRESRFERISEEEVKSYVITTRKVYASPISSLTLLKRAEQRIL
jgi:hypothetical protein